MRPVTEEKWPVEHVAGDAGRFHQRDLPHPLVGRLWWFEVTEPTVVLGSTQKPSVVDEVAARRAGIRVARRRSGGGAVYLAPGEVTWVDVLVPRDDPRWVDDVGHSAIWLGDLWVAVLAEVGIGGAQVHRAPIERSSASDLVCFAGLAPGEVTVDGAKVIGVSQRRTRDGARFQCAVLHRWDPAPLLAVLDLTDAQRTDLRTSVASAADGLGPLDGAVLVAALREHLLGR